MSFSGCGGLSGKLFWIISVLWTRRRWCPPGSNERVVTHSRFRVVAGSIAYHAEVSVSVHDPDARAVIRGDGQFAAIGDFSIIGDVFGVHIWIRHLVCRCWLAVRSPENKVGAGNRDNVILAFRAAVARLPDLVRSAN